jgi:hypothetical protein
MMPACAFGCLVGQAHLQYFHDRISVCCRFGTAELDGLSTLFQRGPQDWHFLMPLSFWSRNKRTRTWDLSSWTFHSQADSSREEQKDRGYATGDEGNSEETGLGNRCY